MLDFKLLFFEKIICIFYVNVYLDKKIKYIYEMGKFYLKLFFFMKSFVIKKYRKFFKNLMINNMIIN